MCFLEIFFIIVIKIQMWRHGERSALADLYPIYEKDWVFGGGGLGELTGRGMGEMNNLGRLIRERYVRKFNFLEPKYASKEVNE